MPKAKKSGTSYNLSDTALELIEAASVEMGISKASVIEIAVRDLAKSRGLELAVTGHATVLTAEQLERFRSAKTPEEMQAILAEPQNNEYAVSVRRPTGGVVFLQSKGRLNRLKGPKPGEPGHTLADALELSGVTRVEIGEEDAALPESEVDSMIQIRPSNILTFDVGEEKVK